MVDWKKNKQTYKHIAHKQKTKNKKQKANKQTNKQTNTYKYKYDILFFELP